MRLVENAFLYIYPIKLKFGQKWGILGKFAKIRKYYRKPHRVATHFDRYKILNVAYGLSFAISSTIHEILVQTFVYIRYIWYKGPLGGQNRKMNYISAIMTILGLKIGKYWELIGTIALEKVLWAIDFVKIGYWAPKAKKHQSSSKKDPKGVQNQKVCYISAIMTTRPKNWQILIPIGTIGLENVLWDIDFVKIGYWIPKAQK